MQPFALLSMLLAATQVFAAPTPTKDMSVGDGSKHTDFSKCSPVQHQTRSSLSNAERIARALPPAPLKRGHDLGGGESPVPQVTRRGVIQVTDTANDDVLGYISKTLPGPAQYQYQPSVSDALILSFQAPDGATCLSSVDLTSENDVTGYHLTGLVQGQDNTDSDIGPSSYHYLYIAGTNPTPVGSTPQTVGNSFTTSTGTERTSESAVWNIDLNTGALTVQWVNSDDTIPEIYTWSQGTALYAGGSPEDFQTRYPAPITIVSYKWIPL